MTIETGEWIEAVSVADIPAGGLARAEINGVCLAFYNLEGSFHATGEYCTHAKASLVDGFLEGDVIECPLHQARFHILTGEVRGGPTRKPLKVYPVREENGTLYVQIT